MTECILATGVLETVPTGAWIIPDSPRSNLFLSLVIPTYNERPNIRLLISELVRVLDQALPQNYELIVVDDDSPDQTWAIALELTVHYPQLRVLRRLGERGLASAVLRGWQVARGQVLGVMDGDFQHPPETLLTLLAAMEHHHDLAIASRHLPNGGCQDWSLIRRILSRGAKWLSFSVLPQLKQSVTDPLSGYFLIRRHTLLNIAFQPVGYKILLEILSRTTPQNICEVGYIFRKRHAGWSKVNAQHFWIYLKHLLRLTQVG
ncbi:polyprenol monophosphomannose synthase [Spirulina subsalsa FACHB-351]|uniref:Polyprenol monophosphomannose synthase n=1 Tax=Spirulina subsalsa FACHB-351 TaxID=234711 RepID=A0ABT3L3I5_9CYAN|nr:polyprenol monophosphomannose synthase [Spirulina subsalsa]MCW6035664.1 polyprenol monophosphomannose synthase [Spirulina subsalsa FACHB-351]